MEEQKQCTATGIDDLNRVGCKHYCQKCELFDYSEEYKENSFDFAYCSECDEYIHNDDHEWIHSDLAVCPKCHTNLEM